MKLPETQLADYHHDGFVVVNNVFPTDELDAIDQEIDRIQEERAQSRQIKDNGWVMSLGLASPITQNFCADKRILDLVSAIVKPGISIYSAKLVAKEPFTTDICHWHQDDAYYSQHVDSKTRMSVWIPLQDSTIEQGTIKVVPKSHKLGLQNHGPRTDGTCKLSMPQNQNPEGQIHCPVKAGSMLLFSALLWHASEGNQTPNRRRAFIISYQEATVPKGNGKQYKILRSA